jgi:Fe(3+) dicitrate transport protein
MQIMIALFLGAAAGTAESQPSWPQAMVVAGIVRDAGGAGVPGMRIVAEPANGEGAGVAMSDAGGRFRIVMARSVGALRIRAYGEGFHEVTVVVEAPAAGDVNVTLRVSARLFELAPLAVVGTAPGALRSVPGATRLIPDETLRAQRPAAAHEVLRRTSGVHVQDEDPLGLNLNIGIRGLNPRRSSRVLLLEDGVPIHLGPYADPSAHYQPPAEVLRGIEVVKGSGQIRHGPQTVGGVINFLRRPAGPGSTLSLAAGGQGRRSAHLTLGRRLGDHGVALSLTHRAMEGARTGWHHRSDDAAVHGTLDLGRRGTLALKAGWYTEDSRFGESGLTQAEFEQDPFGNPLPEDIFKLRRLAANVAYTLEAGPSVAFSALAYGQDIDRTSWRQANSSRDRFGDARYAERFGCSEHAVGIGDCGFQSRPRHYRFAGIQPGVRLSLDRATFEFGARLHAEQADRRQFLGARAGSLEGATRLRDNVITTTAWSAFAHARLPLQAWALMPGVRIEDVRSANENRLRDSRLSDRYRQWLPGIGIAWNGLPTVTAFAGVHRGFAPPRPADIFSPAPGESLVQVDPEVSWNVEAGVRGLLFGRIDFETTAFRIHFQNQIVDGSLAGSGQRFVNAGATLHQGVELEVRLPRPHDGRAGPTASWALTFLPRADYLTDQLSSVDGTTSLLGKRIPFAPRSQWNATLGAAAGRSSALLRIDYVGEQFGDDLNTRVPSPDGQRGVLHAYTLLGLNVSHGVNGKNASLFASIENLTGRIHITQRQEGIMTGLPRRFMAGMEWSF